MTKNNIHTQNNELIQFIISWLSPKTEEYKSCSKPLVAKLAKEVQDIMRVLIISAVNIEHAKIKYELKDQKS